MRAETSTRRLRRVIAVIPVAVMICVAAAATSVARTHPPRVVDDGAGLTVIDTFDDHLTGSLRDQGAWHVNMPGAADGALVGDVVPPDFSGKTLVNKLAGTDGGVRFRGNAYASLGPSAIAPGATGTVFFEIATADLSRTRLHLGLSPDASPGLGMDTTGDELDLDDFGPELTVGPAGLTARDGAASRPLVGFPVQDGVRYLVWLVVDNARHVYSVHAATPGSPPHVLSAADGTDSFAFRTSPGGALQTFLHLNDPDDVPSADTYLDTLAVAPGAVDLSDPSPRFDVVVALDSLARGPVDGRGGWSASPGVTIAADPVDAGNRVLRIGPGTQHATRALPALEGGTLFFRMRRSGSVDASLGLTDVDGGRGFNDFRVQTGATGTAAHVVRDGAAFAEVGTWPPDTWQCVWLVADTASDTFTAYSRGGPHRTTTRLRSSTSDTFTFRSGSDGPLDRFLLASSRSTGTLLVDDLAVDTRGTNLRTPPGASCRFDGPRSATPVVDPAPATAQSPRVELELSTIAQLPPASTGVAARRANSVVPVPGSERLAVPALEGPLYLLDGAGGAGSGVQTYLDLSAELPDFVDSPGLGTGFGYVAFAPDFATSGRFYTAHTEAGAALTSRTPTLGAPSDTRVHGVLTEWTATDPSLDVFAGTHREVLRLGFSRFTHGLQQISFNPYARPGDADEGLLYVATGDGDETPYFSSRPSDLTAPQGKLLRIDPRETADGAPYSVPADNPYVGRTDVLGEVWASGLRNPHRFSWDPVTGRVLLGNIGEKSVDSVYEVTAGDRFGWNAREGAYVFDASDPDHVYPLPRHDTSGFTYPELQIGRNAGKALVGGFVYRGRLPALRGHYVFGDIVAGGLREVSAGLLAPGQPEPAFHDLALVVDGRRTTLGRLTGGDRVDLRLGQDARGELYVLSKALGRVWKVTGARDLVPAQPSCFVGRKVAKPSGAGDWRPLDPRSWRFRGTQAQLAEAGRLRPGPRGPREYAVIRGHDARSFELRAQVRSDGPRRSPERDVVLIYHYTSRTSFDYVHLSNDTRSLVHNGAFVVDDSDRRRADDQWDGARSGPAAISDFRWHDVRLTYCAGTRTTYLHVDGRRRAVITSTDDIHQHGRVGFGSFDNVGRIRGVRLTYVAS